MGKTEIQKSINTETSPLSSVTNERLFNTIQCPGFLLHFNVNSLKETERIVINNYGARGVDQGADIADKNGNLYRVHFVEDIDNRGIIVTTLDGSQIVTKVVLRNRTDDATLGATPPEFLYTINGVPLDQAPPRSKELAFTTWSYSNPGDKLPDGTRMAELSIVSADPERELLNQLIKKNSLFVPSEQLARFIDDPFSYIPRGNAINEDSINTWWKYWFQVVNRGLRNKSIPQPGQTSQKGFEGFFSHSLSEAEDISKSAGYTHLSAVPTWTYVWHSFIEKGYLPTDSVQGQEAETFINMIRSITLLDDTLLTSLSPKNPIASWLAVAPYVIELSNDKVPVLGIDDEREARFHELYSRLKAAVKTQDGI